MSEAAVTSRQGDDATLVGRARIGDEEAVRELVRRHNRRLYRVARAVLADDSDAEDTVQETWLRAFRSLDGFRGQSGFATWVTRIGVNEALQRLRRRRRTPASRMPVNGPGPHEADVITFPGAHTWDPEGAAARRQLGAMIEAAVEKLSRPMRIVFMLRDVEELSVSETAEQLGVPEATVKTRLHRARKQLRKQLGAEIAMTLSGTFPFAGNRCERMADQIIERLRDPGPPAGTAPAGPVESFVHQPDQADVHQVGLHQVENPRMYRNPRTTAQIAGHPIHPMLIPFPVSFLVATLACDLVYWSSADPAWSAASVYLLGVAIVMAGLAAIAGLVDFFGDAAIRQLSAAWHHMIGNIAVVLLSTWNWYRRYSLGDEAVLPLGLVLSLIVVILLLYTGWRGWEMVYKHRVAVADHHG